MSVSETAAPGQPSRTSRKLAPDLARGAMLLLIAMAYDRGRRPRPGPGPVRPADSPAGPHRHPGGGAGFAAVLALWSIRLERTRGALTRAVAAMAGVVSLLLATWLEATGRPGPLDQLMRRCVHGGKPKPRPS